MLEEKIAVTIIHGVRIFNEWQARRARPKTPYKVERSDFTSECARLSCGRINDAPRHRQLCG